MHVFLPCKLPLPFDERGGNTSPLAGSESTTALISLGALDSETPRLVFEAWLVAPSALCGGVELLFDFLIICHGSC